MAPGRYIGLSFRISQPNITIEAYGAEMDGAATEIPGALLTWGKTGDDGSWTWSGLPAPLDPFPGGRFKKDAAREAPTAELQAREDLYVCDGDREKCVKYRRRPPSATLGRGEYTTDRNSRRLLLCPHWQACSQENDWAGRLLLMTTTPEAIVCTAEASGVTIRGLTVRRYAPQFHDAQVDTRACAGLRLEQVAILESHAIGWWAGPDSLAVASRFESNGQLGAEAGSVAVRFEDSSCSYNNTNDFPSWNAGGCKFFSGSAGLDPAPGVPVNRTTWIGGKVCGNRGNGLWMDISVVNAVVRNAFICNNKSSGVHYELSYGGVIENNVFRGNGTECSGDKAAGSAVLIQETERAVVRNNLIYVTTPCGRGINLRETSRPWNTKDNEIVENVIVQVDQGNYGTNGFWILETETDVSGNIIDRNSYVLSTDDNHRRWRWQVWKPRSGGLLTFEQWQQEGYDRNGRVLRVEDPAAYVNPAND